MLCLKAKVQHIFTSSTTGCVQPETFLQDFFESINYHGIKIPQPIRTPKVKNSMPNRGIHKEISRNDGMDIEIGVCSDCFDYFLIYFLRWEGLRVD